MKKKILPLMTLLATFACGSVRADGTEGDIWQILPCDRYGQEVDRSSITTQDTVPAGSNIYFKVRLVSKGDDWTQYSIVGTGLSATNTMINPPKICIYVSGKPTWAEYVGEIRKNIGTHFTDVVFTYTPKAGDYAMPVKLGTASGPASDKEGSSIEYFFDPLSEWEWQSKSNDAEPQTAVAKWFFFSGDPETRQESQRTKGLDYSLSLCKYYIKTVDFDSDWEEPTTVWRTVHEGSDTIKIGSNPSLEAAAAVTEMKTFYIWSDNEDAVKVSGPNVKNRQVKTGVFRDVAEVTIYGGQSSADFEIWGVKEGGKANLIMSAYPKYNISDATGVVEEDYVTVPVVCAEKLPPTIRIVPESTKVVASSNYTYYVTELNVYFTQAYEKDVTFTVTPQLEVDSKINWKDYLAIYDEKTLDIAVAEATNTTYTIPKDSVVPMENGAQKRIYLFALRGDENTVNTKHIGFVAKTENFDAHQDIDGWDKLTGLMNINAQTPEILEPVEGDASGTATAGADYALRIKVADTYADQNVVSNGYQIFIIKNTNTETQFEPIGGESARYVPGQDGCLYLTNAAGKASTTRPTVQYSDTTPAVNHSIIYVKSPISGKESDQRKFDVTVNAPASCTINVIDENGNVVTVPTCSEGYEARMQVTLDRANGANALYAFLVPQDDASAAAIQCSFVAKDDNYGMEISPFNTESSLEDFVMIDGRGKSNSSFKYKVELRTAALYQAGVVDKSYQSKNLLVIKSSNVIPTVEKVYLGLDETQKQADGKYTFPELVIAKGVMQTFTAGVNEPGLADLSATGTDAFQTRWRFSMSGVKTQVPSNADSNGVIYGDPETNKANFKFTKAGTWTVTVDCKDKDMTKFGSGVESGTFTFYVEVVDQPSVEVSAHYRSGTVLSEEVTEFNESDGLDNGGNAYVRVALTYNKCDFPLTVQLAIADPGTTNPGEFKLQTNQIVTFDKRLGDTDYYKVQFSEGETSIEIPVKSMDGTKLSKGSGFQLTTSMLTDEECPESGGVSTKDYFLGQSKFVRVINETPLVPNQNLTPQPMVTNNTAIAEVNTIHWDDIEDVVGDFSNPGITVKLSGDASAQTVITDPDVAEGELTFKFTSSGPKIVYLTFTDKDDKSVNKFTFYYEVAPSKTLRMIPHGPTTGISGMYQSKYGEGRVYADGTQYSIAEFNHTYNCGLGTTWRLYGYGYKVGDRESGSGTTLHYPYTAQDGERTGYQSGRNHPLDASGNGNTAGGFAYLNDSSKGLNVDANGDPADSFLYAWIKKSTEESSGSSSTSYSVLAYKPEAPEATSDAGTEVELPTEELDDGGYSDTTVEAVFSLEYLWSDNMGDINMDGIPDAWFHSFSFTETSESVDTQTGTTTSEETSVDDTTSVAAYNEDEDYLPDLTVSGLGYILDYTDNREFSAITELRGYGEALNDAPNNNSYVMLTGFKPDRCYLDPDVVGTTSTLSKVEFLAWQEYAAAHGYAADKPGNWSKWTPENPTDPTELDTDGDGFDDGFEYAFWYRAHVGFYDGKVHTYLTGRKFDPKNPGKGKFIKSETIEELMNPTVPSSEAYGVRDSDDDGLPDALEFTLGTNPFDFDTDGDGLTDGYEVLVTATDPLKSSTESGTNDGSRNLDGDHMAYTTLYRVGETLDMNNNCGEYLLAVNEGRPVDSIRYFTTFALASTSGDTDGAQWYAVLDTIEIKTAVEKAEGQVLVFSYYKGSGTWTDEANWANVATTRSTLPVVDQDPIQDENGLKRLAITLDKTQAFLYETDESGAIILGEAVRVPCGSILRYDADQTASEYSVRVLDMDLDEKQANAAWFYGNETVTVPGVSGAQQLLALGRHLAAKKGDRVVAEPLLTRPVALMHHYVYQHFGFDPRTAWSSTTPLASHWSPSYSGYVFCHSTRTRKYTALNEELLLSYLINTGSLSIDKATPSRYSQWATIWSDYTTNPRGVGEGTTTTTETETDEMGRERTITSTQTVDVNGADTDGDGVPDGWELYVMGGTKDEGQFTTVDIADGGLSPLVAKADDKAKTDTSADNDELTELQEYAGTDSSGVYTNVSTTIVRPSEQANWINKYFPSDPWNADTDGDGLTDAYEIKSTLDFAAGNFLYGTPEVDKSLASVPGGGLNPCSVDTDLDGLPDAWEAQFAGTELYAGEFAESTRTGNTKSGNTSWGLIDGMDGTVADAYTTPNHKPNDETTYESGDGLTNALVRIVSPNRDYDHDGLENWQEYMVGAMRCWRYDDPYSRWDALSGNCYTNAEGEIDVTIACQAFGFADENEFWYRTLVDKSSEYYNPHFVFGMNPGAVYWSRVTNSWDVAYDVNLRGTDSYYQFYHRSGNVHLGDLWGAGMELDVSFNQFPTKYATCSPINADTDQDGMDDYYELFHGMNPLLGQSGVRKADKGAYDVIYDVWFTDSVQKAPFDAENNWWTSGEHQTIKKADGKMDFVAYPWLNGSATADPDGDDVRNQEEAIMPELATATWHHTDPTPFWMTDSSFSNSLVRLFGRMPTQAKSFASEGGSFTFQPPDKDLETYYFYDMDGYACVDTLLGPARYFRQYLPERWYVANYNKANWLFSFEENEGYDSDHDGLSDYEELEGKFRTASDPIDVDSPRRRQAMYFQGETRKSLLMTTPVVREKSPDMNYEYPDDMAFLQYTVECWAYPESDADATLLERALWVTDSNLGDEEFLRCNFQLAIKGGKWYTKFDPRGTLSGRQVELFSADNIQVGKWTHIAATYDANTLILYVNGNPEISIVSGLQPEYGASVVSFKSSGGYAFDREYPLSAILVGASAKTEADGDLGKGSHLNVFENQEGLDRYKNWFKGYIDEIRIWDGARSGDEIRSTMKTRYTSELAIANRDAFYDQWSTVDSTYPNGRRRYAKDSSGNDCVVTPELRYHYAFDSVFASDNESQIAKVPHGFGDTGAKTPVSRPVGYEISWWSSILSRYVGTVYNDPTWVTWIPNTIAHLPRFDGTTLDSCYWSEDFRGDASGTYKFQRTAEPVTLWTQRTSERVILDDTSVNGEIASQSFMYTPADYTYRTMGSRHHLVNSTSDGSQFHTLFDFTGRHKKQSGDDLLPLGGAYVKYCDETVGLWDEQGASTTWEITGNDADNDGLPDWWETYADENYRLSSQDPSEPIGWNTIINYHGNTMKAGDAYMRDLAKGFYADAKGEVVVGPTKYRQTYDENANGIPDWWESVYRLTEQNALADSDNDGLPNYLEYMLSEIFDLGGKMFSPVSAYSVDRFVPDYFFRLGSLYVGEVFTDHDLVDDLWEDQYETTFASRLKYDAFQDQDEDGWSNRSENRYSNQCMPLVANNQSHYSVADGLVADYPIPTVALTLRYNGARQDSVRVAPIVVEMTTSGREIRNPDAVYNIGQITTEETGSTKDKEATEDTDSYAKTIGKWSNRRAIGTLTPGNIDQSTLLLQYCADPSALVYNWEIPAKLIYGSNDVGYEVFSGTAAEYANAQRKFGKDNVTLLTRENAYITLENLVSQLSETGDVLTWICNDNSKTIGTVNLTTGAYDLNLGAFEGVLIVGTNAETTVSLESQTFRIAYSANPSVGLPRKLYLGDATSGHVREGLNTIVAFADLDSSGTWNPGEPYGIVRNVDVSWRGTSAEIELTDISPVIPRIDIVEDTADRDLKRADYYADVRNALAAEYADQPQVLSNVLQRLAWMDNNVIESPALDESSTEPVRVRVARWLVNGIPVYQAGASMRVLYDQQVELGVKKTLTEADILCDEALDLDWQYLRSEIIDNSSVRAACGAQVTNMTYLVVIGDGPAEWHTTSASGYKVTGLSTLITRNFEPTRTLPQAVSPGDDNQVVVDASPTFTWEIAADDLVGYTAFKVQVMNKAGELVYDSGIEPMPSRIRDNVGNCRYQWQAPLFVGDKTTLGKVFANGADYTWRVAAYNAKFVADAFSTERSFRMNVSTNGYSTGRAEVAVKYYGPKNVWAKAPVRVRAFTSPDFTGRPVAGSYVVNPADAESGLCTTGIAVTANSTVIGLPVGKYYLQAFVDSNTNGTCEAWETQGYYCMRDGTTSDYLNPVAITFDTSVGNGDLVTIYLEDSDTDMDGLPDAWEYATYGSLTKKGIELLTTTPAGEAVVNTNLTGALTANGNVAAGLAAKALSTISNAGTLALALGAPITTETSSFNDAISGLVSDELAEDGVEIEQLEIVNGEIVIKVTAESTSSVAANGALNSVLSTAGRTFEAVCDVERTESLSDPDWKTVKSQTITVGGDEPQTITLDADEKSGGFYRVTVRK